MRFSPLAEIIPFYSSFQLQVKIAQLSLKAIDPCFSSAFVGEVGESRSVEKGNTSMGKKLKVGIVFGGQTAEHEVSLQSGKNIINALNRDKYEVAIIGIQKSGQWQIFAEKDFVINPDDPKSIALSAAGKDLYIVPGKGLMLGDKKIELDVVFPIVHGPQGEDGTLQGVLRLLNLPFVGADILGAAVGLDKDSMKRMLVEAELPVGKYFSYTVSQKNEIDPKFLVKELGLPIYVKPANMGSSVGITRVTEESQIIGAIGEAFKYDKRILFEANIEGREIECAVLGNDNPKASVAGEIIPMKDGWYSYEGKYIDAEGAKLEAPAKISEKETQTVQEIAIRTFKALYCKGFARVDVFLKKDGSVVVNEINTHPGFTKISMYPKLWELSGIKQSDLIDQLIQLALE
jgi:D-alanine-D-alanine ligase